MSALFLSSIGLAEEPSLTETTVFANEADGYPVFRIPAIVRSNANTLLAFCEGRAGYGDGGNIDLVLKRSTDNGVTWGPVILVHEEGGTAGITIGNPAPVVDRSTGHIHLLFCRENDTVFHTVSTDDGLTWSSRTEITDNVKQESWGWYATGPVHGVQLARGEQAGRLVIPANHRIGPDGSDSGAFGSQILYSDDHGATWHMDAVFEAGNGAAPNETTLVELAPSATGGSRVYINSRDYGSDPGNRSEAWSEDGGTSYSGPFDGNPHFVTPVCQGALLRYSSTDDGDSVSRILFSSPNGGSRSNGAIWVSTDEAATWSQPKPIHAGAYAYSDMVRTADDHLGVLFETGTSSAAYQTINFIRANEAWIDTPPPPAENPGSALWNLEETEPGQTCPTTDEAILDVHPEENGLHLTATTAFASTAGAADFGNGRALSFQNDGGLRLTDGESDNRFDYGANDSFTIEAVCRIPSGHTATDAIVAKDLGPTSPSWWLRLENGKLRFLVSDNATEAFLTSTANVNDGEWHHIAAVRDVSDPASRELRLYINGAPAGETTDSTTGSLANTQTLWIGRFNASGRELTGDIDFVRITPAALAPEDFCGKKTQFDADDDSIPDSFEREESGSLAPMGPGDLDLDTTSDLLEFALATDPTVPDAPALTVAHLGTSVEVSTRQRLLPDWLGLQLTISDDLRTWSDAGSSVSLAALDDGIWERTDRIDFPAGTPARGFFRYELRELP
ncbi:neuraminidase [Haloferula helveola]|uniref:exo-alpha-sialidase n=1 Tax=Haloferula helveola TaxID=490095 RepID=A0ABN6GZM4_9BACT|nr:neuraminidase [Haloferula helveola]